VCERDEQPRSHPSGTAVPRESKLVSGGEKKKPLKELKHFISVLY